MATVRLTKHEQVQNLIADLFAAAKQSARKGTLGTVLLYDDDGEVVEIEVKIEVGEQT
ncbi:MAG TPA: hypothetical protein VMZ06_08410 [Candidatus Bathyarchaeia archaeon]|nr:hypothetical protein [Phycisphaerae bacterium]HUW61014.1 hypothetical protein [Candidatus Bathyarchaeia archaeon]HUW99419.1 hypothetical protein [Phycisphaerae bacterium]